MKTTKKRKTSPNAKLDSSVENKQINKGGRPTKYTQELADSICKEIAIGRSIRSVCLADDMPDVTTVFKWIREKPEFSLQYARACDERTESQQEILIEMGDEAIKHAETADSRAANAVVSAYKLKADNLKWSMSKMKPKKYGDKLDLTSDGEKIAVMPAELYAKRNTSSGTKSDSD